MAKTLKLELSRIDISGRVCSPNCSEGFVFDFPADTDKSEWKQRLDEKLSEFVASGHHNSKESSGEPIVKGRLVTMPSDILSEGELRAGAIRVTEVYEHGGQEIHIIAGYIDDIIFRPKGFKAA